ncbi:MAG: ClpXP protease specificity-enhancing factor SspB [Xanthobacteraceae bacterium]|jgi:uncharacterized protein
MPDHIRYDIITQQALRGVVRTVLADVATKGLPGEHHFNITFNTAAPGVRLSDRMRAQYPEAMTIILQHQFWDLSVGDDAFEVGLSFGGVPERLAVPFDSIIAFYDPSVQFGFQFEALEAETETGARGEAAKTSESAPEKSPAPQRQSLPAAPAKPQGAPEPPPTGTDGGGGGEVVRLDRFRKK